MTTTGCNNLPTNPWNAATGTDNGATVSTINSASDGPTYHSEEATSGDLLTLQDNTHYSTWDTLFPGSTVYMPKTTGQSTSCSLTMVGQKDGQKVGVSAGHCFNGNANNSVLWQRSGDYYKKNIGTLLEKRLWGQPAPGSSADTQDIGIFTLDSSIPTENRIAGRYTITDVYGAQELQRGMQLCKYGYRSKETCGTITMMDDERVGAEVFSRSGDSGAPAYVKLGGNNVALVGSLKGSPASNDHFTYFTLIKPLMDETGMTLS